MLVLTKQDGSYLPGLLAAQMPDHMRFLSGLVLTESSLASCPSSLHLRLIDEYKYIFIVHIDIYALYRSGKCILFVLEQFILRTQTGNTWR